MKTRTFKSLLPEIKAVQKDECRKAFIDCLRAWIARRRNMVADMQRSRGRFDVDEGHDEED